DCDHGNGNRVLQVQVNGDDAFGTALQQQAAVLCKQLGIVVMDASDKEVIFLPGVLLDPGNHLAAVTVTDVRGDHTEGVSAFVAERPGHQVGLVLKLARSFKNSAPGSFGNVFR